MSAYDKIYLDDIEENMGSLFSYAIVDIKIDKEDFYNTFVISNLAKQIEIANPKYVGMSYKEWLEELNINSNTKQYSHTYLKDYWIGYMLGYYAYVKTMPFIVIKELGINYQILESMYIYHEAPLEKFVEEVDRIIESNKKKIETKLSIQRKKLGYSQSKLAKISGVSLRMIQLYEQRQNDISLASVKTVRDIANALKCEIKDIIY